MSQRAPWFPNPSRAERIRNWWHRKRCARRHFPGYPDYMVDSFGHWRG
jgi:hypothetical protein